MTRWAPQTRADGTPIWVNRETGEVCDSLAELVTGRSWDAGLAGLVAADELDHAQVLDEVVAEVVEVLPFVRVSRHDHVGSLVFEGPKCWCSTCGQAWVFGRDGRGHPWWVPQWSDYADGQVVMLGRRQVHHRRQV